MIGQIKGVIVEKQAPELVIDVHGVGYEIQAPMGTFYQLPDVGQSTTLFTHFVVREDAQLLYGFHTKEERALFRALLKVNGVGPRSALTILSSTSPDEFIRCVLNNDTATLVRTPGIGKKTAERLVIEMKDKLSDWFKPTDQAISSTTKQSGRHQILQDAISALITLGYKQNEASRVIAKIDDGVFSSEELIRRSLREMAS